MPNFSKKANLVKDLEAIVKSRTIKAYLCFYQGRRRLLLYQHHLFTGTTLEQTLCWRPALGNRRRWDEILFRAVHNCGWLDSNDGSSPRLVLWIWFCKTFWWAHQILLWLAQWWTLLNYCQEFANTVLFRRQSCGSIQILIDWMQCPHQD